MQRHRILCGDSTTMQGQERDIVFLSMVTDRASARTMADRKAGQRFNVAMSRARDRLYLVRSVARSHLKPADLKHKVIAHFDDPLPNGTKIVDASLIDRCQSGFEREVCKRLFDAGYRVVPQMKAGAFAIDLVVEGTDDRRLAIELDGDRYHGPDRWDQDMARQAALERAGWVFWRVFGSQWKADPDLWWRRLVKRLDDLGIAPIGSAAIREVYTEHRVLGAEEETAEAVAPSADERHNDDVTTGKQPMTVEDRTAAAEALPHLFSKAASADSAKVDQSDAAAQNVLSRRGPTDSPPARNSTQEAFFRLEDTSPEIVESGMAVTIYFTDTKNRRTVRISMNQDDPDDGVINIGKPLAQALLGAAVGETIEIEQVGGRREAIVERILTSVQAAE
jgi:very-short-patch-repair endonuclease